MSHSSQVTEVGVEPTRDRLSTCRLYQLAYSVNPSRSLGLEPGIRAYETQSSACPPAIQSVADLGVEPSIQAYETQSGAGPSAIKINQGEWRRAFVPLTPCSNLFSLAAERHVVTVGFEPTLSTF